MSISFGVTGDSAQAKQGVFSRLKAAANNAKTSISAAATSVKNTADKASAAYCAGTLHQDTVVKVLDRAEQPTDTSKGHVQEFLSLNELLELEREIPHNSCSGLEKKEFDSLIKFAKENNGWIKIPGLDSKHNLKKLKEQPPASEEPPASSGETEESTGAQVGKRVSFLADGGEVHFMTHDHHHPHMGALNASMRAHMFKKGDK